MSSGTQPPREDDEFRADLDRLDALPARPPLADLQQALDALDEGLTSPASRRRARDIDDLDAGLAPPASGRILDSHIDRLDENLAEPSDRSAAPRLPPRPVIQPPKREHLPQAPAPALASAAVIVPPPWELALAVAGFLLMMSIGAAGALLLFVDRVVSWIRTI